MSFIQATEHFYDFEKTKTTFVTSHGIQNHEWLYDASDLADLMSYFQEENVAIARLSEMGGVEGIAYSLRTDLTNGIGNDECNSPQNFEEAREIRERKFGINEIQRQPPDPLWKLCIEQLGDPMLIILLCSGCISIIIGAVEHPEEHGWIDGFAILIAVLIVVTVGGTNDWQKEKQFRAMEEESSKKDCIVRRGGKDLKIPFPEVLAGDLIVLRAGYSIPADGIFVLGTENFKTEEAGLTGEAREIQKSRNHPLLMKGTQVVQGEGLMLAVAIGDKTEWGKLMAGLQEERGETPLQLKLEKLGNQIGIGGTIVAVSLFLILLIGWLVSNERSEDPARHVIDYIIMAITIVVVAVPEGLPLAVTISLAYSMKKMVADNNFVRHLSACETMGNATTICSDKTGTLTENRMTVTKAYISRQEYFKSLPSQNDLHPKVYQIIVESIVTNSKAFVQEPKNEQDKRLIQEGKLRPSLVGGNQTECAMLQWAIQLGASDYSRIREENPVTKFFPFDSAVKRSSVLVKTRNNPNMYNMYTKGAAEQLMDICTTYLNANGEHVPFGDAEKREVVAAMDRMTRVGLRCLGLCYRPLNKSDIKFSGKNALKDEDCDNLFINMTWLCVCGIQDPVRKEVPDAVLTCQRAGVIVRMVTGDHLETAKHIAKQCRILTCKEHICMTGSEFRSLTDDQKLKLLPNLRVLARSKPSDKEELVKWYKEVNGDVVAVTGDGANDALALSKADVGLAMGIQGTDVAKEASDIIIMDDNFASIEKTVMWGRSVYDNIRKFIQFQLTVNAVALTISLIAAFFKKFQNPLTAVQLLWVNLIMDTMAALALATEQPTRKLLERFPFQKEAHLITQPLWRFVIGHATWQLTVLLVTMFIGKKILNIDDDGVMVDGQNRQHLTLIFNTFVWLQIFNEINARRCHNEINVFENFFKNYYFISVIIITVVLQAILINFGGDFSSTRPLNLKEWGWSIGFGASSLIVNQFIRLVPVDFTDGVTQVDSERVFKKDPEFDVDNDNNSNNLQVVTH